MIKLGKHENIYSFLLLRSILLITLKQNLQSTLHSMFGGKMLICSKVFWAWILITIKLKCLQANRNS